MVGTLMMGLSMAVVAVPSMGCGRFVDSFRDNFRFGLALTEAEHGGAVARAEVAVLPIGQLFRVWTDGPTAVDAAMIEVLGGDLADVVPGEHLAGPDGMIVAGDLVLELRRCEGETIDDVACAPIESASIVVVELAGGDRLVSYDGTALGERGAPVAIHGSFVVGE